MLIIEVRRIRIYCFYSNYNLDDFVRFVIDEDDIFVFLLLGEV